MDINIAIAHMGMGNNMYKLDKSDPPHNILAWYGPDPQPTEEQLLAAWEEYEAGKSIPDSIDMRRARLALWAAGHLTAVNAAIEAMEGEAGEDARIEWEYATTIKRDHPVVATMQTVLGLTDEDLDNLFVAAATLA